MAQVTITIPNAVVGRVVDAVCAVHEYPVQVRNANGDLVPNPQSRVGFTQQHIRDYLMAIARTHESRQAAAKATAAAILAVNTEITIT